MGPGEHGEAPPAEAPAARAEGVAAAGAASPAVISARGGLEPGRGRGERRAGDGPH